MIRQPAVQGKVGARMRKAEPSDEIADRVRRRERRFVSRIEPFRCGGCVRAQPVLVDRQHPAAVEDHSPVDHHAVDRSAGSRRRHQLQ